MRPRQASHQGGANTQVTGRAFKPAIRGLAGLQETCDFSQTASPAPGTHLAVAIGPLDVRSSNWVPVSWPKLGRAVHNMRIFRSIDGNGVRLEGGRARCMLKAISIMCPSFIVM